MLPLCPHIIGSDRDILLRRISERIDDGMLNEIAAADYGRDIQLHLPLLQRIRDHGEIPVPLAWEPREVLELIRWSEPDDLTWGPGGHGERGQWMRAFACAALIRIEFDPANFSDRADGQNQTLAGLLVSIRTLDSDLAEAAPAFVAWGLEVQTDAALADRWHPDDLAFFGVALLWTIERSRTIVADAAVIELCQWISACEAAANAAVHKGYGLPLGSWLLSTTHFNLRHAAWRTIGADLAAAEFPGNSCQARDWVRLIGAQIAGV
jgi:hypothetical protein